MTVWAVIVAAGKGRRMGADIPKVLLPLLGHPVLWWTLSVFEHCPTVDRICLVADSEVAEQVRQWGFSKLARIVPGGETRGVSVLEGLKALPEDAGIAAIHDGARPCVSHETIEAVVAAARQIGGAAAGWPLRDTLQQTGGDGYVIHTPGRDGLWAVQTPQAFDMKTIREAYGKASREGFEATDDVGVARWAGIPVRLVPGNDDNIKVTVPGDIQRAEKILKARMNNSQSPMPRIGLGVDTHRLVPGRALILGGVSIAYERGLDGHSDADVLTHAVMDALLGAAALGDIGRHFPDSDAQYKDADSLHLLAEVIEKLHTAGYRPCNVDATVIAQKPRLAPYIDDMRTRLATVLGISRDHVNVKATTTEGLGPEGRGEGITAQAVALIAPRDGA